MKRRSWIRPKRRERKVLWRTGRVIEDAAGMKALRLKVYRRAGGRCEVEWNGKRCNKFAPWSGYRHGHLVHIVARGHGRFRHRGELPVGLRRKIRLP